MTASIFVEERPKNSGELEQVDSDTTLILKSQPAFVRARQIAKLTGLRLLVIDIETHEVLGKTDPTTLEVLPEKIKRHLRRIDSVWVVEQTSGLVFYAIPLPQAFGKVTLGIGYVLSNSDARPHAITLAAAQRDWSQQRLDEWFSKQVPCSPSIVERLLKLADGRVETDSQMSLLSEEINELGTQLDHALAEICLERIPGLIPSEGCAIRIDDAYGEAIYLSTADMPIDKSEAAALIARFEEQIGSRPLVKNDLDGTLLGTDFPKLKSIVMVPIIEGSHRIGWLIDCNINNQQGYRTVEVSLLNSVASILGTHRCNLDLYLQHEELLISFVHSLVSTLDAKDPYTRDHSERVARFARRIGQQMKLPFDDLQDIYLAGLLHDVGKVGIDDRILRKKECLTDDEFAQIKQHPVIGHRIVSGLTNLKKTLPGIRSHHERIDGLGYPDGLKGDEIPMMARILAVADSYDAMLSSRTYRKGMSIEKVESILTDGAGTQWDSRVVDAYFSCRNAIARISQQYKSVDV